MRPRMAEVENKNTTGSVIETVIGLGHIKKSRYDLCLEYVIKHVGIWRENREGLARDRGRSARPSSG